MLVYAVTIFLSAFLLFQIQPVSAKIILPWFGGSAAVWSACLMFFQLALLLGYLYAYCSTRFLKPRMQAAVHVLLLTASLFVLRVIPPTEWKPVGAGEPVTRIVWLLAATIGLPYLMLSTTSPLLQSWYQRTNASALPYRLFALSNFGSLLALLSFPIAVEPYLAIRNQARLWSGGYIAFAALGIVAALVLSRRASVNASVAVPSSAVAPRPLRVIFWLALAACPSVLLLSVTTHLTQNVAPIPFLWVLPLSVYLLTFILCFERDQFYPRRVLLPLLVPTLGAMAWAAHAGNGELPLAWAIALFSAGLFLCCMVCHGELARRKPDSHFLTLFYLMISAGGAVGGLFVALIAPRVFTNYFELPLGLILCALLALMAVWTQPLTAAYRAYVLGGGLLLALALAGFLGYRQYHAHEGDLADVRNFYGMLRIRNEAGDEQPEPVRELLHGTILHGRQVLAPSKRDIPTSYYGEKSGVGLALGALHARGHVRAGMIGLGAGVLASYCRPGDVFRFYEINPLIVRVATEWFSFLNDCTADKRVWYAEGKVNPGFLLPSTMVRAVMVVYYTDGKDAKGRPAVRQRIEMALQTDSHTINMAARVNGASAPHLAEQYVGQIQMFYGALAWYLDQHPRHAALLFAQLRRPSTTDAQIAAPME